MDFESAQKSAFIIHLFKFQFFQWFSVFQWFRIPDSRLQLLFSGSVVPEAGIHGLLPNPPAPQPVFCCRYRNENHGTHGTHGICGSRPHDRAHPEGGPPCSHNIFRVSGVFCRRRSSRCSACRLPPSLPAIRGSNRRFRIWLPLSHSPSPSAVHFIYFWQRCSLA